MDLLSKACTQTPKSLGAKWSADELSQVVFSCLGLQAQHQLIVLFFCPHFFAPYSSPLPSSCAVERDSHRHVLKRLLAIFHPVLILSRH